MEHKAICDDLKFMIQLYVTGAATPQYEPIISACKEVMKASMSILVLGSIIRMIVNEEYMDYRLCSSNMFYCIERSIDETCYRYTAYYLFNLLR